MAIPYGYCHCGCGQKTRIAHANNTRMGHAKGEPYRYLRFHHHRKAPADYRVEDRGYETPCWIWQLSLGLGGYPQKTIDGKTSLAHRWMYEQHVGPIPSGLQLDHLCRNRACVNPGHLEPVVAAINVRRQPNVKLTIEKAREIRSMRSRPLVELARTFGVHPRTIGDVLQGITWRELPDG